MTITLIEIDSNVQAISLSSVLIGTGDKTFVLESEEPFIKGLTVTIKYDNYNYMSGVVKNVTGTIIVINISSITGSGTYSQWTLDATRTLYFGTETYISKSTDSPANKEYAGDIKGAGSIEQYAYDVATTFGKSRVTSGEITINNYDGRWDFIRKLGFKKASLRIKQIKNKSFNLPTENVFSGTVLYPEVSLTTVRFDVSDRLQDLEISAQKELFSGNNSGPTGIEGTENDIKGLTKPFIIGGKCFNIQPPLLNSSKIIYGVNFDYSGNTDSVISFDEVRDNGVILLKDTSVGTSGDVANLAALQSATIAAGKYATCLVEGLIRLSSSPAGIVTCDVTQSSSSCADIVKSLIERIGLTSSDYVASSFTDLDSVVSYDHELYSFSDNSVSDLCNELLSGVGAFLLSDSDNKISVGYLKNPDLFSSIKTFDEYSMIDLSTITSRDPGKGIPPKQIKLNYSKNYSPFSNNDFAGSVSDANRELYSKEYKINESSTNVNIDNKYYLAPVFEIYSHITNKSDCDTELARQLTLRQIERYFYSFKTYDKTILKIGDIIKIKNEKRFGLFSGKNVIILGKEIEFSKSLITYIVWG